MFETRNWNISRLDTRAAHIATAVTATATASATNKRNNVKEQKV